MKPIFAILFLICLNHNCKEMQVNQQKTYIIQTDLENDYDSDFVIEKINGETIFSGEITTDYTISLAKMNKVSKAPGQYSLSVEIPHSSAKAETTFIHTEKDVYIGIKYSRNDRKLFFHFSYTPTIRD